MKQGNNIRRGRGRGQRKPHSGGGGGQHGGGMSKGNQTYDSNGPEIRVRGNAHQVLEKYLQMARDAGTAGDRVAAENYLQHAEHYYRMIAAQTEGQRPRVGGRDLSVADVNVQNVSQGLSAALYATPNVADGMPGAEQGNEAGANGNYAGNGGEEPDQFNGYHNQNSRGGHRDQGQREQGQRDQGHRDQGHRDHGSRDQGPRDQGRRDQNRRDDGSREPGNEARTHDGRSDDGRGNEGRDNRDRGPRRFQRGRDGQRHDGQRQDGQRQDGYRQDAGAVDGNRYVETQPAETAPAVAASQSVDRAGAEQPDYPSELVARPVINQPAVVQPDSQPALTEVQPSLSLPMAEGAAEVDGAEAAAPKRGRGRPRSTSATPRRSRSAAAAEEAPAVTPSDGGE